jgi:surface polysaccharide O-acyltransferase-like enzyme
MPDLKRYYAFDSLRASMMLLGVVIHSAMSYSSSNDMSWPLRAKDTNIVFFLLVDFLHAFRMPVFFLIAGFFGSFLFFNKGPEQMLKNRFKRIFLPFLAFLVVLYPCMIYAFKYCKAAFNGEIPISLAELFSSFWNFIPLKLFHLWFLHYLFIISVLVYLFSKLTKHISFLPINSFFERTFKNPIFRLLILTDISFIILFLFGAKSFETSISWIPDLGILFYYFAFYLTGWLLYRNKELISTLKRFDIAITVIGVVVFCFKLYYHNQSSLIGLQIINSIITCSLSLGIIGLFLRFFDTPNNYVTYFVNSAYWVYLMHFFIAILLSGLLNELSISVYLKFLIVLLGTTIICLISYHFFVRKTFIGEFLNGKKV